MIFSFWMSFIIYSDTKEFSLLFLLFGLTFDWYDIFRWLTTMQRYQYFENLAWWLDTLIKEEKVSDVIQRWSVHKRRQEVVIAGVTFEMQQQLMHVGGSAIACAMIYTIFNVCDETLAITPSYSSECVTGPFMQVCDEWKVTFATSFQQGGLRWIFIDPYSRVNFAKARGLAPGHSTLSN